MRMIIRRKEGENKGLAERGKEFDIFSYNKGSYIHSPPTSGA